MSTPILIAAKWGGFQGISGTHCDNLCWYDRSAEDTNGTEFVQRAYGGCLEHTNAGFMTHPGDWAKWFMVSLMTGLIPGCIAPAALHRVLVAKSDKSIAQGMALVHAYPYAFFTPGILMGVTK